VLTACFKCGIRHSSPRCGEVVTEYDQHRPPSAVQLWPRRNPRLCARDTGITSDGTVSRISEKSLRLNSEL
jgi:hypothetical protein